MLPLEIKYRYLSELLVNPFRVRFVVYLFLVGLAIDSWFRLAALSTFFCNHRWFVRRHALLAEQDSFGEYLLRREELGFGAGSCRALRHGR